MNRNAKRVAARAGHAAIAVTLLVTVAGLGCGEGGGEGGGGAPGPTIGVAPFVLVSGTAVASRAGAGTVVARPTPGPIAGAEEELWREIAADTAGGLRPLLRPPSLPAGLETVLDLRLPGEPNRGAFAVEYAGPGRVLVIAAGPLNPPPGFEPGHQEPVTVRGQRGVLAVGDDRDPAFGSWVYWQEPGSWTPEGSQTARPDVTYLVRGTGMSPAELLDFVEGLQPWAPE